jgi:phosphatidate phosphatase PAH1
MSNPSRSLSGRNFMLMFAVVLSLSFAAIGASAATAGAAGNDVVVFDIDGTLTNDTLSTTPQPGAVQAVKAYEAKGYAVVYVTARWKPVQELATKAWLALNGFPSLPLYMSSSLLLGDSATVKYKTNVLKQLETGTPEVAFAYGDQSTDFTAYGNVGVAQAHVFALKRASSSSCEAGVWAACLVNYTGHLSYINALPPGT